MPVVNLNGTNLYFEEHGQGIPLIMIQGFAGTQAAWHFQVRAFQKYFRVITFDARGLGHSDVSRVPYTFSVMEQDVIGLMDYLKIEKAHILGLSLGGIVAQAIAINHPERVKKLVLCSTLPAMDEQYSDPEVRPIIRETLRTDVVKAMNLFLNVAFNRWFYRLLNKFIPRRQLTSEYGKYFKQMQSLDDYNTLDQLNRIQAPTLVLTGSGDRLISPHSSEIIASRIPHARLAMVKGGSHAFFLELRGRFNREVLNFLKEN